MMKDKKYRRGLQNMDDEIKEEQPSFNKEILENNNNEMDYEKFEDIYDPILETELTTQYKIEKTVNTNFDYKDEENQEDMDEDEDEEASVFSQRLWNSFLQKIKN